MAEQEADQHLTFFQPLVNHRASVEVYSRSSRQVNGGKQERGNHGSPVRTCTLRQPGVNRGYLGKIQQRRESASGKLP